MAQIRPFRAVWPNPSYANKLIYTTPQVESVAGEENVLAPLKTLLETGARKRPETPEGQARAYLDIKQELAALLKGDKLRREQTPGIYVYEVIRENYRQTGIWALTSLEDYIGGAIKIHELTFDDSVRRLKNYRQNTGLEGSPILLTYAPDITINRIIAEVRAEMGPSFVIGNEHGQHRLWKIENEGLLKQLVDAFAGIETVYLADGHHRIESSARLAVEQRAKGLVAFDTISSLYMATDQLRIEEYDRIVIPSQPVDKMVLFEQLKQHFDIHLSSKEVFPQSAHKLGLYFNSKWYNLTARPHTYINKGAAGNLDAAILQEYILAPVFGIADPKTDQTLKCAGGEKAMEEIATLIELHPHTIAFTLCPVTVEQLIAVADAGEILPPKSTWIVPKIPYGLLLQHYEVF
jgi:uncharacterized protein (DUF1015 family)